MTPPADTGAGLVVCPDCSGDGKETCHNPDHGFIGAMSFHDIGRLGCPVCGHDERHKVRKGGPCDTCEGLGGVPHSVAKLFCEGMEYDFEPVAFARLSVSSAEGDR